MLAVILGTGPSLSDALPLLNRDKAMLFGVNNVFRDIQPHVWIACDPKWHEIYSPVSGDFDKWHWDVDICKKHGYQHIEGRWGDGLSTDPAYIHYGHSSGYQALGLAVHYGAKTVLLVGYDMHYDAEKRHYFDDLSNDAGEYPQGLRKYSNFKGLIGCYETIAAQKDRPEIINCTPESAMTCFPMGNLSDYM